MLNLIKNDPWLEPFSPVIEHRHQSALEKEKELCGKKSTLSDFADGYLYFGLHRTEKDGWIIREWAPNATEIFLIGDFSDWKERPAYRFKPLSNGVWEIKLDAEQLHHLDLYKLSMHWEGGQGERVPAWATRVVQDETTKIFSAQVWSPEKPYIFKKKKYIFRYCGQM